MGGRTAENNHQEKKQVLEERRPLQINPNRISKRILRHREKNARNLVVVDPSLELGCRDEGELCV